MGYSILHFLLFGFPGITFYQVTKLFEALDKKGEIEGHHNKKEGQALDHKPGRHRDDLNSRPQDRLRKVSWKKSTKGKQD